MRLRRSVTCSHLCSHVQSDTLVSLARFHQYQKDEVVLEAGQRWPYLMFVLEGTRCPFHPSPLPTP